MGLEDRARRNGPNAVWIGRAFPEPCGRSGDPRNGWRSFRTEISHSRALFPNFTSRTEERVRQIGTGGKRVKSRTRGDNNRASRSGTKQSGRAQAVLSLFAPLHRRVHSALPNPRDQLPCPSRTGGHSSLYSKQHRNLSTEPEPTGASWQAFAERLALTVSKGQSPFKDRRFQFRPRPGGF